MEGLTLSRYRGQRIVVTHRDLSAPIVLTVIYVAEGRARINIQAPDDVVLMRGELLGRPRNTTDEGSDR